MRQERGTFDDRERKKDFAQKMLQIRDSFATSFDTFDMKQAGYDAEQDPNKVPEIKNHREKLQLHDLVMLTDIYSIP